MNRDIATILVLSENRERAKFLRSILVRAGHWACIVDSPEDAIQFLLHETSEIPLMVMDFKEKLPGSPLQAVLASRRPKTRFIYLSDTATERNLRELNKNSFWPIMSTSFAPGEFLRIVDIVLKFEPASAPSTSDALETVHDFYIPSVPKRRPTRAELKKSFPVLSAE